MQQQQGRLPAPSAHHALSFGQVPTSANAYLLSQYAYQQGGTVLYIGTHEKELQHIRAGLAFFAPNMPCQLFPNWDVLPYDRTSPSANVIAKRMHCLHQLLSAPNKTQIILTTIQALSQKLMPKAVFEAHTRMLRTGEEIARNALTDLLMKCGYHRASKVIEPGEFAVRGSIIDIFTPDSPHAVRLDFFDDEIESIRALDVGTQRSGEALGNVTILPIQEILLNEETISHFRQEFRARFGSASQKDVLYHHISNQQKHPGFEHWLGLFYEKPDSLLDYANAPTCLIQHESFAALDSHLEAVDDYYQARQHAVKEFSEDAYHPSEPALQFLSADTLQKQLDDESIIHLSPYKLETGAHQLNFPFQLAPNIAASSHNNLVQALQSLKDFIAGHLKPCIVACQNDGSAKRLSGMLEREQISHDMTDHLTDALKQKQSGKLYLCVTPIERGFICDEFAIFSEQDLLGERMIRTTKKRKKSDIFLQEAISLESGELIVHREHGIGKFDGLVTIETNQIKRDCAKLLYHGGDRLFIPVENIDLISRYGSEHQKIELDKLGGVAWQRKKSALKKKLKIAASALIKTAAQRAAMQTDVMTPDTRSYEQFCAAFPYVETDDQLQAVKDVLTDLDSGRVMDRLICGDVGFGKTEIAMRAAFVAASQGHQVAIVVPTTLLARQHYQNFVERFKGFDFNIKQLSRMVSAKEAGTTREALKSGDVDIVIGTHALLADKVGFSNLRLLIIDEEQHFGVKQKEKLKALKDNIHVLTLSATPIPRTLQLSLNGIRELSLIATAPIDRLAIRSVVTPFDIVTIKEAILREKHRGGQSFVVTPRIQYMDGLHQTLKEALPELKIATAHGQMTPTQLDKIMQAFSDGHYDILLSTAIIESGIDIANANTMVIDHAELFGLAQLYQLRGRIGRGKIRAHAYFTLPPNRILTQTATRRLEVMQKLDHLGAGFSLASHDMDIRGFGNVLGEEQSGHIKEVGIELYQAMLEEAIEQMRQKHQGESGALSQDFSPQINIGIPVLIPESYIEDLGLRVSIYRRAANLKNDAEIEDFTAEMVDRFGKIPEEMQHLLRVIQLKTYCKQAGILKLEAGPKAITIEFHADALKNPDRLIAFIAQNAKRYKLRTNQTILVQEATAANAARIDRCMHIAKQFVEINTANASSSTKA